ncbi:hypothetical protein EJB05_25727, partial [Eragrostis curvula]
MAWRLPPPPGASPTLLPAQRGYLPPPCTRRGAARLTPRPRRVSAASPHPSAIHYGAHVRQPRRGAPLPVPPRQSCRRVALLLAVPLPLAPQLRFLFALLLLQSAPSAVLLVHLLVVRSRGCRSRSSSSLARAPAMASRASAASPTPPKPASELEQEVQYLSVVGYQGYMELFKSCSKKLQDVHEDCRFQPGGEL